MKYLAPLAATLLFSAGAFAAGPSTESVEQLLAVTKSEQVLGAARASMDNNLQSLISKAIQGRQLNPKGKKAIDDFVKEYNATVSNELSWSKLKPNYVKVYAETFTQDEINGMLAFYKTPAGQAMIQKMPVVMQKTMVMTQQQVQPMMQKIQTSLNKALHEAQENSTPAGAPTAPAAPAAK